MRFARRLVAVAALLAASCQGSGPEPSQSLVGVESLPPPSVLNEETIQVNRFDRRDPDRVLSLELDPGNGLLARLVRIDTAQRSETALMSETLALAPDVARRARERLWRLRPAELTGVGRETRPVGCEDIEDAAPETAIIFVAPDGVVGVTLLPERCDSEQARLARELVAEVLQLLPASEVVEQF